MTLRRYTGLSPKRVSKDAKYSVTTGDDIKLEFRESQRTRFLLTTSSHARLAEMVNEAKTQISGQRGGGFYINEFGDVLVPDGQGGSCFWAGHYDGVLEFSDPDENLFVSPLAPHHLKAGDRWDGPHVGIPYKLHAGGDEISYEIVDGRRTTEIWLSDTVGPSATWEVCKRISAVKGKSGGRFFINEQREMFAPVGDAGYTWLYIGNLGEDAWFPPPDGFDRP